MDNNKKNRDIYDNGFNRFLSRGDKLPLAKIHTHPDYEEKGIMQGVARANFDKTDVKNGVLYFKGKEINFNKAQNQKYLLKILFKRPKENWAYDEIAEDTDWDETGLDTTIGNKPAWTIFYSAGDSINDAVEKKTQINDFIIKNTKEIRINPNYV